MANSKVVKNLLLPNFSYRLRLIYVECIIGLMVLILLLQVMTLAFILPRGKFSSIELLKIFIHWSLPASYFYV